jgi:uncharacterized protein (DUF305 family)
LEKQQHKELIFMQFSRLAAVIAAASALAVAGCGSTQATSPTTQSPAAQSPASSQPAAQATHNDADITFAQQMIPHHAQAIAMAEMATTHAASPKVRELAANIKQAQQPEIDQMTGWLQAWGAQVPSTATNDMGGMGHGSGGSMPGMMSAEQMNQMNQASGAQFDRMFLQMMIEHHTGAIEMAQTEVNDGENSEAQQLAQKIITDQQNEIIEMQALLQEV